MDQVVCLESAYKLQDLLKTFSAWLIDISGAVSALSYGISELGEDMQSRELQDMMRDARLRIVMYLEGELQHAFRVRLPSLASQWVGKERSTAGTIAESGGGDWASEYLPMAVKEDATRRQDAIKIAQSTFVDIEQLWRRIAESTLAYISSKSRSNGVLGWLLPAQPVPVELKALLIRAERVLGTLQRLHRILVQALTFWTSIHGRLSDHMGTLECDEGIAEVLKKPLTSVWKTIEDDIINLPYDSAIYTIYGARPVIDLIPSAGILHSL